MVQRSIAERISNAFNLVISVFGIRIEKEPAYREIVKQGTKSIRSYSAYVIVKTQQMGDLRNDEKESFYKLFNYISGENEEQEKMPMTAPVLQGRPTQKIAIASPVLPYNKQGWDMSFVLPQNYSPKNAPTPSDASLKLDYIPAQIVGVIRYSGAVNESRINSLFLELKQWLESQGYQVVSDLRSARYDPPFTLPFLRRNEIHVDVVKVINKEA